MRSTVCIFCLLCLLITGCGTTRWTDTKRTSTEQLLISDAIDRAVSQIDLRPLAGHKVYLDAQYLEKTIDENYTISVLRQHMLASGCRIANKKEDAEYIVEARAGAVGTSRHDLLYGLPSTDLSLLPTVPGVPSRIPEIPIAKKTEQQGAAKIAVFAYHRETGLPFWQSGNAQVASTAKDLWVLGIGPFERGTIRDEIKFAGDDVGLARWSKSKRKEHEAREQKVWVAEAFQFQSHESIARQQEQKEPVRQAQLPKKPGAPAPQPPAAKTPPPAKAPPQPPAALPPGAPAPGAYQPPGYVPPAAPRGTIQGVRVP